MSEEYTLIPPPSNIPKVVVFSIVDFAKTFGIGKSTVYVLIQSGQLKVRKVGARTLITYEDAMNWFNNLPTR